MKKIKMIIEAIKFCKWDLAKLATKLAIWIIVGIFTTGSAIGGWLGLIAYLLGNMYGKFDHLWEDLTQYCAELHYEIKNQNNGKNENDKQD
jgi:hypothetical protein